MHNVQLTLGIRHYYYYYYKYRRNHRLRTKLRGNVKQVIKIYYTPLGG